MSSYYDSFDYCSYWEGREYEDASEKVALKKLFSLIPMSKKSEIFDIGGGFGRLSESYCGEFEKCTVIEPSVDLIETGIKKNVYKNLSFIQGSLPHLETIKDHTLQNILMVRVIHHIADFNSSFKEIDRIMKPGGYFILEIANKVHFLARIKALFSGNWRQINNFDSIDLRSKESISKKKIGFFNHHPIKVLTDLTSIGFTIEKVFSVSNFRSPFLKRIIPFSILIKMESISQVILSKILFGPSIFILAKKN